jgi:hypothetical protein
MAVVANITIDQGSAFDSTIDVEDASGNAANLSGYTARGQIRKTYASSTAVDFSASILNATAGTIRITLDGTQTAAMKAGRYVYDVEIVSSAGIITRVVEGQVEITPRVTRV